MAAQHLTISVCQVPVYRETKPAWVNNTETKPGFLILSFDVCLFSKNLDLNKKTWAEEKIFLIGVGLLFSGVAGTGRDLIFSHRLRFRLITLHIS